MPRTLCRAISDTAKRAKHRFCTGSIRGLPTFRRWCARSTSDLIRGSPERLPCLSSRISRIGNARSRRDRRRADNRRHLLLDGIAPTGRLSRFRRLGLFLIRRRRKRYRRIIDTSVRAQRSPRDRAARSAKPTYVDAAPSGATRTRTTTSSRKPRIGVRAIASMSPRALEPPAADAHRRRATCAWSQP